MERLEDRVERLNARAKELNEKRARIEGERAMLEGRVKTAIADYKSVYGVTVTPDSIEDELKRVEGEVTSKADLLCKILDAIDIGDIATADTLLGIQSKSDVEVKDVSVEGGTTVVQQAAKTDNPDTLFGNAAEPDSLPDIPAESELEGDASFVSALVDGADHGGLFGSPFDTQLSMDAIFKAADNNVSVSPVVTKPIADTATAKPIADTATAHESDNKVSESAASSTDISAEDFYKAFLS